MAHLPLPTEEQVPPLAAQQWIACDKCDKWRTVPGFVDLSSFSSWNCEMNEWDAEHSKCDAPEIDEKELKRRQARDIKNEKKRQARDRDRREHQERLMGPVVGASGKILKCPNCRPNRNYTCSRCKAKQRGEEVVLEYLPRVRRPKDVLAAEKRKRAVEDTASEVQLDDESALLDTEGVLNPKPKKRKEETEEEKQLKEQKREERKEHERAAKERLKKVRNAAKKAKKAAEKGTSVPLASIIEFMDKGGGELRNMNVTGGVIGKKEDGDEREGYGQADMQGLEDELDGYISGENEAEMVHEEAGTAATAALQGNSSSSSSSKDMAGLRTNLGLHSREATSTGETTTTGERDIDVADGRQIFGLGVDALWGPEGTAKKYRKPGKPRASRSDSTRLPESLQFIHRFALKSYIEGNLDASETALKELIEKAPSLPDSYGLLGLIYEEKRELEQAVSMYITESQKYKGREKRAASWAKTAKLAVALRDRRALFTLDRAQFYNKDDIEIRALKLRYTVVHSRSTEKGWSMLKAISKLGDSESSCYYDLGEASAMVGRGEEAALAFAMYAFHVMGRTELLPPAALGMILHSPDNPDHRSLYSTTGINLGSLTQPTRLSQVHLHKLWTACKTALDVLQNVYEVGDEATYDDTKLSLDLYECLLQYMDGLREQAAQAKEHANAQMEEEEVAQEKGLLDVEDSHGDPCKSRDGLSVQLPLELAMIGKVVQLRSARIRSKMPHKRPYTSTSYVQSATLNSGGGKVDAQEAKTSETVKSLHAALSLASSRDQEEMLRFGTPKNGNDGKSEPSSSSGSSTSPVERDRESQSPHALIDLYLWRQRLRVAQELHLLGMITRAERIFSEMKDRLPSLEAQLQLYFCEGGAGAVHGDVDRPLLDEDVAAVNALLSGAIPVVEGVPYSGTLHNKYSALVRRCLCEAYTIMSVNPKQDDLRTSSDPHVDQMDGKVDPPVKEDGEEEGTEVVSKVARANCVILDSLVYSSSSAALYKCAATVRKRLLEKKAVSDEQVKVVEESMHVHMSTLVRAFLTTRADQYELHSKLEQAPRRGRKSLEQLEQQRKKEAEEREQRERADLEGTKDEMSEDGGSVSASIGGAKRSASAAAAAAAAGAADVPTDVPSITAYELNRQKSQALEFSSFDINYLLKVLVENALATLRKLPSPHPTSTCTGALGRSLELYLATMLPILYAWGSGLDYKLQERVHKDLHVAKIFSQTHKERTALSEMQICKPSLEHLWREMVSRGVDVDGSLARSLAAVDTDRIRVGSAPYHNYCRSLSAENHRVFQFVQALVHMQPPELALGREFLLTAYRVTLRLLKELQDDSGDEKSTGSVALPYESLIGALKRRCSIQESSAISSVAQSSPTPSVSSLLELDLEAARPREGATAGNFSQQRGLAAGISSEGGVGLDVTARKVKAPRKPRTLKTAKPRADTAGAGSVDTDMNGADPAALDRPSVVMERHIYPDTLGYSFSASLYSLNKKDRDLVLSAKAISALCAEAMHRLVIEPGNIEAANIISQESRRVKGGSIERFISVSRLVSRSPNAVPSCLFSAHESGARRRYSDALEGYLDAFVEDPTQPMVSLSIATILLFFANHYLVGQRMQVLVKGLAFLQHYKDSRIKCLDKLSANDSSSSSSSSSSSGSSSSSSSSSSSGHSDHDSLVEKELITEDALAQEVFYNTGRAFHELKLHGLATRCYRDCLEIADRNPSWTGHGSGGGGGKLLHVTKQAAHNYTLLLRAVGSEDEAFSVMTKYLTL